MRRYKFGIGGDCEIDALDKMSFRNWRDGDIAGGMLHTEGILVWAEHGDLAIRLAEGFHSFIALNSVIESWCHTVDG